MGRRETIFRLAKGFRGRSKNCWSLALRRVPLEDDAPKEALGQEPASQRLRQRLGE